MSQTGYGGPSASGYGFVGSHTSGYSSSGSRSIEDHTASGYATTATGTGYGVGAGYTGPDGNFYSTTTSSGPGGYGQQQQQSNLRYHDAPIGPENRPIPQPLGNEYIHIRNG